MMHPSSPLEMMHRYSIDSLDPLSASVPAAMADIWSVLAMCSVPYVLYFLLLLFFLLLLLLAALAAASKHLRLSHPALNVCCGRRRGGVEWTLWLDEYTGCLASTPTTLSKYRKVFGAETQVGPRVQTAI